MNLRFLSILLGIAGEILIVCLFFLIIPKTVPTNILILDFIVTSIVYWLWIFNILKPAVNLSDRSQRQVGGIGLRWSTVTWYSILSFLCVGINLYAVLSDDFEAWSFPTQAFVQGSLAFLLLVGLLASEHAISKTREVYYAEQSLKSGKRDVKGIVKALLYTVEDTHSIPDDVKSRLKKLSAETRYITPSQSDDATRLDEEIIKKSDTLRAYLADYDLNKSNIEILIGQLERALERRRRSI